MTIVDLRCAFVLWVALCSVGAEVPSVGKPHLDEARKAEERLDVFAALKLYKAADVETPNDPFILQKIAQQLSDSTVLVKTKEEKLALVNEAMAYALRAAELAPTSAVNQLSVAICYGKLAAYADDTRSKIVNSRRVKQYAERALELEPGYAWAHHTLGRWHYEVAKLNGAQRWLIRLIYGGLPEASYAQGIAYLRRAVELEPSVLVHELELAHALGAAGQWSEAISQFEAALKLPDRGLHDAQARGRAEAELGRLREISQQAG